MIETCLLKPVCESPRILVSTAEQAVTIQKDGEEINCIWVGLIDSRESTFVVLCVPKKQKKVENEECDNFLLRDEVDYIVLKLEHQDGFNERYVSIPRAKEKKIFSLFLEKIVETGKNTIEEF